MSIDLLTIMVAVIELLIMLVMLLITSVLSEKKKNSDDKNENSQKTGTDSVHHQPLPSGKDIDHEFDKQTDFVKYRTVCLVSAADYYKRINWMRMEQDRLNMTEEFSASNGEGAIKTPEAKLSIRLVYTYEDYRKDQIDVKALKIALGDESDTFRKIAESLKTVAKEANPNVQVVYEDMNGEIVYTEEFSAIE